MSNNRCASMPWLTVVMPSHGGEQWIGAALESIAAETDGGVEVLVIDSSPTSANADIARGFADRLDLRVLERPDLANWPHKTNVAVEIARASHLCWLHVDDLWLPGRAAAVRSWIEAAPEAPLHLAPGAIVDRDGRRLGVWRCPLPANRALSPEEVLAHLLVQNFVSAPAPVFRRDAWMACGGLDLALWYTADWDIWLKLAARGPVYYHDLVTTAFRIHSGSMTMTGSRAAGDFTQQMQIVLDRHLAKLEGGSQGVERAARASIAVNVALAEAAGGRPGAVFHAVSEIVRLGPAGIHRYIRDSRIVDRVAPRVRAKLTGRF